MSDDHRACLTPKGVEHLSTNCFFVYIMMLICKSHVFELQVETKLEMFDTVF